MRRNAGYAPEGSRPEGLVHGLIRFANHGALIPVILGIAIAWLAIARFTSPYSLRVKDCDPSAYALQTSGLHKDEGEKDYNRLQTPLLACLLVETDSLQEDRRGDSLIYKASLLNRVDIPAEYSDGDYPAFKGLIPQTRSGTIYLCQLNTLPRDPQVDPMSKQIRPRHSYGILRKNCKYLVLVHALPYVPSVGEIKPDNFFQLGDYMTDVKDGEYPGIDPAGYFGYSVIPVDESIDSIAQAVVARDAVQAAIRPYMIKKESELLPPATWHRYNFWGSPSALERYHEFLKYTFDLLQELLPAH